MYLYFSKNIFFHIMVTDVTDHFVTRHHLILNNLLLISRKGVSCKLSSSH